MSLTLLALWPVQRPHPRFAVTIFPDSGFQQHHVVAVDDLLITASGQDLGYFFGGFAPDSARLRLRVIGQAPSEPFAGRADECHDVPGREVPLNVDDADR